MLKRKFTTLLTSSLTFAAAMTAHTAFAQNEATPAEATPVAAETAAPVEAAPEVAAESVAAAPTLEDRVMSLEAKQEGAAEAFSATDAIVQSSSKLKISGYIQGRYEWHDDAKYGLDAKGNPLETNRFYVRRGRLKALYAGTNSEYMLQIDATGDGVVVKDAEASVVDTWTPLNMKLTVGQFKVPFGYEVLQSSGDREMPERALVIRKLFPGERDRGVRLIATYNWLKAQFAAVNGNFTGDQFYKSNDQTKAKDIYARFNGDWELGGGASLVAGVSYQYGHELPTTPGKTAGTYVYNRVARTRAGVDGQFYYDVPGLGGFALKGEYIWAKDSALDFLGVAANPCNTVTSKGWIVTAIQNFNDNLGFVLRADSFDPNTGPDSGCTVVVDPTTATTATYMDDKVTTLGGGPLFHVSGNAKFTVVYEHLIEQSRKNAAGVEQNVKSNDVLTIQLQSKF